jgi:hypothetical protein
VAIILYEKKPAAIGAPDTRPELVLSEVPAGNVPLASEYA